MAKSKASKAARVMASQDDSTINLGMREQFRAEAKEKGLKNAAEAAASDVGLPLPHFCQRVLFQRTTLPLERVMIIFGPSGSNKSTLLYYFYDLFRRNNGMYFHIEVESKDTPIMRLAMTDYDYGAGWGAEAKSMDDIQTMVKYYIDWFKSACAQKKAVGRVPFVLGVDSLVAKLTQEAKDRFDANDGAAMRRFSDEARSLSDWFKYAPELLQGFPFSLIAINHDKPKPAERPGMPATHSSPGGSAPNFYATYRLLCTKVTSLKMNRLGYGGNRIRLSTEKSSLGPDKIGVDVEVRWGHQQGLTEDGTQAIRQHTFWDWDKATTELLVWISGNKKNLGYWSKAVDRILGVRKVTGGRYACRALDVSAESAMKPSAMGRLLETRQDLLRELEDLIGVQRATAWTPNVPFAEQLAEAGRNALNIIPVRLAAPAVDPDAEEGDGGDQEDEGGRTETDE